MIWHSHSVNDVLQELQVNPSTGLSEQEAIERLKEYGKNSLQEHRPLPFRQALAQQLRAPLTILLLIVAGLVMTLDLFKQVLKEIPTDWEQALIVALLALVSIPVGATLHYYAAKSTEEARSASAADARVKREGKDTVCNIQDLVPGDIVILNVGDIVPADCRLLESHHLQCDECSLTQITSSAEKDATAIYDNITPLAQRTNMLYAGSVITSGTAIAVVVATGTRSEMGRTQRESRTQPSRNTKPRWRTLCWNIVAVVLCILAIIVGLTQHADRSAVILTATSLLLALVPKNADHIIALLSARSVKALSSRHIRVHRPKAMEKLGRVTVFCTDQESLIEGNDAQLERAFVGHQLVDLNVGDLNAPGLAQLLRLASLNVSHNDPYEHAIITCAERMGIDRSDLLVDMPRIGELIDANAHKTGVHLAGEQTLILVSGGWRTLLPLCTKGNVEELTAAATAMEKDGLQVLAITYRLTDVPPAVYTAEELERDLACAGLLGLQIPLRQDVYDAVTTIPHLRTILFSNEPSASAAAAAIQSGVTYAPCVATAEDVEALTEEEWSNAVEKYNVYCGLTTNQKKHIVSVLQERGHAVAVTGSKSEDAPLLAQADVSFVRSTATDVAKREADILLSEDQYVSAIAAIWKSKQLKVQRLCVIAYLILCAVAILMIGVSGLFGWTALFRQSILMLILHLVLMDLLPLATIFICNVVSNKK